MGKLRRVVLAKDLKGPELVQYLAIFNRRLTKRLNACKVSIIEDTDETEQEISLPLLSGGVKINFKLNDCVQVKNTLEIGGSQETFVCGFRFSTKSVLVMDATSQVKIGLTEKSNGFIRIFHITGYG